MRRLAVLVLAACTQQHSAEPLHNSPEQRNPTAAAPSSWRELDPTGASWGDVVDKIPVQQRAAMAYALVREGNFECPRRVDECGMESVDGPRDDERIDAPCLRRALVHWLLANEGHAAIPADVLATLARVKDPELIDTVARTLDDRSVVDWLVAVEAAGTPAPYASLLGRPRDVIVDAARRHVDSAIAELSFERDRDLVIAAISDTELAPQVRADLLLSLSLEARHDSNELVAALRSAVAEPHCELAARSAEALATFGDRSFLPRRPATRDPKAFFHAACVLAAGVFWTDSQALAATFVPAGGLVVNAPKGGAFAETHAASRETITADAELIPLLRTLVRAKCDHATCVNETTRYDLGWTRDGKLARLTVHRDLAAEQKAREAADVCVPGGGGD